MRKMILGFIFLFSVLMLGVSYHVNTIEVKENFNMASETISLSSVQPESVISYKVNHYFPKLNGEYEKQTKTFSGNVGDSVTASYDLVVGYSFDSSNVNNVLSGTLTEDDELELHVYYVRNKFTVYLKNNNLDYGGLVFEDGTPVPSSVTILFGQSIYLDGDVLVLGDYRLISKAKTETAQYRYKFEGFDLSEINLDADGKFTIVNEFITKFNISYSFSRELKKYEVSWMNDGKLIYKESLYYGETPEYNGETPTKDKNQQYSYSFYGWSPYIEAVTGNVSYHAQYNSSVNYYTVTFEIIDKNLNYGSLSLSGNSIQVPYGTSITISPDEKNKIIVGNTSIIARPANNNAQYEYLFELWQYDSNVVEKNLTISAKFSRIQKTFTVLWLNEDKVIEIDNNQTYGSIPTYDGKTPVKASTAEFSYKFTGWSPRISSVTKNVNYYAQFEEIKNCYSVSWKVNNVLTELDEKVPYGTMPEYNLGTPSLPNGDNYYFVFEGWYRDVTPVTSNVVYEALFSKWYTENTVDNDNRIWVKSTGLRSDIIFKAEEVSENRTFILPKDMETVIVYKASLTRENENYKSEEPIQIVLDLKNKFESNRIYHVYMNIDGEIVEPEVTTEGSKIIFNANEIGSFVVFTEIIKEVNLLWLIITLSVLIVAEACVFYFVIVKKYKQYKRQIELSKVSCNALIGLPLIIRFVTLGNLIPTIILGVLFLAATGFIIYCIVKLVAMKKMIPEEEEEFIYIPTHAEDEFENETCPLYTGPKRDFSKLPKQTYYDIPYRPVYYYQPIPVYQQATNNLGIDEEVNEDEIIIENGEVVRISYKRSFMSRIIQGSKEIQDVYTKLRNEISAYPKLKSRVGWEHESVYTSRETIVLFKVKNDTLCVFLALDPSKYNKAKLNFEDAGSIKKYKNIPMLIKIRSEEDYENVVKLIEQICKKLKINKEELGNEDYHYEFRTDKELIEEGLIKEVKTYSNRAEEEEEDFLTEKIRNEINVSEAKEALTDEQALSLIQTVENTEDKPASTGNKKTIVNIGTLSRFYEANEIVNLETLKTKKIVSKDTGYVKILASGVLDKPLQVEANSYSIDAVKMILLTGGKVSKI